MEEYDPALEFGASSVSFSNLQRSHSIALSLDISSDAPSLGNTSTSATGLGNLASELAQAEIGPQSLFDELGGGEEAMPAERIPIPSTPRKRDLPSKVSTSPSTSVAAWEEELQHEAEVAFTAASELLQASLEPARSLVDHLRAITDDMHTTAKTASFTSTVKVERLSRSLLQTLSDLVKQRDAQTRDMRALENALVSLAPHQIELLQPLEAEVITSPSCLLRGGGMQDTEPLSPLSPNTGAFIERKGSLTPPPPIPGSVLPSTLNHYCKTLQASTNSLLSTLANISEATQVHGAVYTELAKRLKSIRTTIASWQAESHGLVEARAVIQAHERAGRSSASQEMRRIRDEVSQRLECAEREAYSLLQR